MSPAIVQVCCFVASHSCTADTMLYKREDYGEDFNLWL